MNLLSDTTASFAVACDWESSDESICKYAKLSLHRILRKHTKRNQNLRIERGFVLNLTLWEATKGEAPLSVGKSFRRVGCSEKVIKSWDGPCRILAASTVTEIPSYRESTWVAVALSQGKRRHGILLARVGQHKFEGEYVIAVKDAPLQAIVLRGPRILVRTLSDLVLSDPDGQRVPWHVPLTTGTSTDVICETERDTDALLLRAEIGNSSRTTLSLAALSHTGSVLQNWENSPNIAVLPRQAVACLQSGIIVMDCFESGDVFAMDLRTGSTLLKGRIPREVKYMQSICFFQGMVIFRASDTSDLWCVETTRHLCAPDSALSFRRLFPESCGAAASAQHDHFYAPWRDCLLQLSDATGTSCADAPIPSSEDFVHQMMQVTPSPSTFSRNLELRANAGVRRATECAARTENKRRILKHVQNLVLELSGRLPPTPRSRIFDCPFENVCCHEDRQQLLVNNLKQRIDKASQPRTTSLFSCVKSGRALESCPSPHFVTLRTVEYGLDKSKRFAVVLVKLELLSSPTGARKLSIGCKNVQLSFRYNRAVPVVWECCRKEGLHKGDIFWVVAYSPVATITGSLTGLQICITVNASNGCSQRLGAFSISNCLSCCVDTSRVTEEGSLDQFPFLRCVSFIAEGSGGKRLHALNTKLHSALPQISSTQTRENLTFMSIAIGCATELAMSIARLQAVTDDEVDFRNVTQTRISSLGDLDDTLLALETESRAAHDLVARQNTFGYTSADIRLVMEKQMITDENFGLIEESRLRA